MSGPLIIGLIDWVSGDVARRPKITARGAWLRKSLTTVSRTETAARGRKPKQRLKETEGLGRKWRSEEAESGDPQEPGPGFRP